MGAHRAGGALALGPALTICLTLSALPASAASFVDAASGFKVDPPAPFFVQRAKSTTYDIVVVVNSMSGSPPLGAGDNFLCQVGYKKLIGNNDLVQEEINLAAGSPDRLENLATALSRSYDVTGKAIFDLNGATGIELIGKPRDAGTTAGVFVSMIDTPAGRTTLNCATRPEDIDRAVEQFRLIRASVTPPGAPAR